MNAYLLNRSIGTVGPQELQRYQTYRLLRATQPSSVRFAGPESDDTSANGNGESGSTTDTPLPHSAGVNSIVIDKFEGRLYAKNP